MSGNLSFTGAAQRILGDFSNSSTTQRLMFQSNVANGSTVVGALPNGTGNTAAFITFNSSDSANASYLHISIDNLVSNLHSYKSGAGVVLPLAFSTNATERFRLSATENRFQADWSNAVVGSRFGFQTATLNSTTNLEVFPNGTAVQSGFKLETDSAGVNSSRLTLDIIGGDKAIIASSRIGTAAHLPLVVEVSAAERMRIDVAGNTYVSGNLNVRAALSGASAEGGEINLWNKANTGPQALIDIANNNDLRLFNVGTAGEAIQIGTNNAGGGPVTFITQGAERMRVRADGIVGVGTLTVPISGFATNTDSIQLAAGGGTRAFSLSGPSVQIVFYCAGPQVGSISSNTTNTAYNTTSDYRLKEDIQDMQFSGAIIDAIKPRTWKWKANGEFGMGFVAHELQDIVPGAVTGEKDAVDGEGEPVMQMFSCGSPAMMAIMVAELKDLRARMAELEAFKAAIEAL
jgi:hypothetical protein